jgi:hypothetical protein
MKWRAQLGAHILLINIREANFRQEKLKSIVHTMAAEANAPNLSIPDNALLRGVLVYDMDGEATPQGIKLPGRRKPTVSSEHFMARHQDVPCLLKNLLPWYEEPFQAFLSTYFPTPDHPNLTSKPEVLALPGRSSTASQQLQQKDVTKAAGEAVEASLEKFLRQSDGKDVFFSRFFSTKDDDMKHWERILHPRRTPSFIQSPESDALHLLRTQDGVAKGTSDCLSQMIIGNGR